jgi:mono/diheme cytochrome c family protein
MRLTLCGFALTLVIAGAFSAQSTITAQEPEGRTSLARAGASNFTQYCVACHGTDAKGTGTLAATLNPKPANLTLLTSRNNGTYPREMVFQVIDGSKKVKGHGGGEMPAWGEAFRASTGANDAEAKRRIESLVDYLETLQGK